MGRPKRRLGWLPALLSATLVGAADLPQCERVLPGPSFARPLIRVDDHALPPASGPAPSSGLVPLAVQEMDLDGSGLTVPVVVMGEGAGLAFARKLQRVDDPSTMNVIWSQDLPGGLIGRGIVEDMDLDGRDDLRFTSFGRLFSFVFSAGFQLMWADGDRPLTIGQRSHSAPLIRHFEDVDGDGLRDAVVVGFGGTTFYPGISAREFDEGIAYTTIAEGLVIDQPFLDLAVGDLDEDGLDDVVATTAFDFTQSIGFARGDGTFDMMPLPLPDGLRSFVHSVHDVDGDGHLDLVLLPGIFDLRIGFYAGWGRGDGTFEPYEFLSFGEKFWNFAFGDVDGDGQDDAVVAFRDGPNPSSSTRVGVFPGAGRGLRDAVVSEVTGSGFTPVLADLDGDDLSDLISHRSGYGEPVWVDWRPSLGDGRFGEGRTVNSTPLPHQVDAIVPTDFDLDESTDLFVRLHLFGATLVSYSFRNDGDGSFELRSAEPPAGGRASLLIDVDLDGRPDLVSPREIQDVDGGLSYGVAIRQGDGLGGYLPPKTDGWLSFTGLPGRVRTTGTRDMIRIGFFGNVSTDRSQPGGVFQLEVNKSLGHVLDEDIAPPVVELRALPVAGQTDVWRLATLPVDECTSAPRVTDRLIDLLPLGTGTAVTFRQAETDEVHIYELVGTGRRGAVLLGAERSAAVEAFLAARLAGGFPFRHMEAISLSVSDEYGQPLPGFPLARLVQRFVLRDGVVTAASVSRPGGDVTFALTAYDGVRVGVTKVSFLDVRPAVH